MEQWAALISSVLAVVSFLWVRLGSNRHVRMMKAQSALIAELPEGDPARKNLEDALAITSERYLASIKQGPDRSVEKLRDWLEVLAWVVLGVGGYFLAAVGEDPAGLSGAGAAVAWTTRLLAFGLMVFAALGWGKAMNKAVFG